MNFIKSFLPISTVFFVLLSIFFPFPSDASPPYNWVTITTGTDDWFYGITYGSGTFVTVGNNGTILTSPDGVIWTPKTSGDTYHLNAVAHDGANTFIAVGVNGKTIRSTNNGVSWSPGATAYHMATAYNLHGITYGNGYFVAVGNNGTIFKSTDGISWESRQPTLDDLYGITHDGNITFATTGESGTIFTSQNLDTWTPQTSGTTNHLMGVDYGNMLFTTVGVEGTILTSLNGVNWDTEDPGITDWLYGVAYGNGYFVAVGQFNGESGTILVSPDGANWTLIDSGTPYDLEGVTYGSSSFAAVGGYGTILLDSNSLDRNGDSIADFVKVIPDPPDYYLSIQTAYNNAASSGDTIQCLALQFNGDLTFNLNKTVDVEGGYNSTFTTNPSSTIINGSLTITDGTAIVEKIIIL